jgi:hypothetical protein
MFCQVRKEYRFCARSGFIAYARLSETRASLEGLSLHQEKEETPKVWVSNFALARQDTGHGSALL